MNRVLVVYKKSALEFLEKNPKSVKNLRKNNDNLYKKLVASDEIHRRSLDKVIQVLETQGWNVRKVFRAGVSYDEKVDLVVSVGGDGTLLESARHIKEIPVLSVNSDPNASVAHYSACNANGFAQTLRILGQRELPLRKVCRLQYEINGEIDDTLILNDILMAHRNPAHATRFILKQEGKKHRYKSSGIWVSSASGSTAAIGSAGGKKLGFLSKRWQYLVREPYGHYESPPNQLLEPEDSLRLQCDMENTCLYLDGPHNRIQLSSGDKIMVSQSPYPLNLYRP